MVATIRRLTFPLLVDAVRFVVDQPCKDLHLLVHLGSVHAAYDFQDAHRDAIREVKAHASFLVFQFGCRSLIMMVEPFVEYGILIQDLQLLEDILRRVCFVYRSRCSGYIQSQGRTLQNLRTRGWE